MEFSSLPLYLDPPIWNQHQPSNQGASSNGDHQIPTGVELVPCLEAAMVISAARPSSMSERARLAKIPQPDPLLKCPRCDSSNTKFCYFNNYSLSQPRHFCKTCRRYWTRGGSLRNVPVGGGCRRNRRSKSGGGTSSKSSTSTSITIAAATSTATSSALFSSNIFGQTPQLPFMASLQQLVDCSAGNIGLNFSNFQPNDTADYQATSSSSTGLDHWRYQKIQQFPFSEAFDPHPSPPPAAAAGLFTFNADEFGSPVLPKVSCSGLITQLASVKMEDTPRFSLPRQYLDFPRNDQDWGGAADSGHDNNVPGWAIDLSGMNSLFSGNLL